MNILFSLIATKPIYSAIIVCALLIGIAYYSFSIRKSKDVLKKIAAFIAAGLISIFVTMAICNYMAMLFATEKFTYKLVFSIFYAFCLFPPFAFLLQKALRIENEFNNYVTPIMLAIGLSRIGCIIEGCCNGTIYAAHIECVLCLAIAVCNIISKKITFSSVFIIYLFWRFISDFFTTAYTTEAMGPFTPAQYLCLLSILAALIIIIKPWRSQAEEK